MTPMNEPSRPYATLTPDAMLDAIESVGVRCDGRFIALNSYENRVYQVGVEDGLPLVAKFYRPGRWSDEAILEEHDFVRELAEQELPVIAPLAFDGRTLLEQGGFRFALYPRRGGRVPDLDGAGVRERLGRLLGRIHAVGSSHGFAHRPTLDIGHFGEDSVRLLVEGGWVSRDLLEVYRGVAGHALEEVRRCYARAGDVAYLRLHGDCYAGNVLWAEDGPHFVDFDDSRMGPAVQDLWMLLSGERESRTRQLIELLAGYEGFREFDPRELHLVEALRTLRLMHYSAWIARRWEDPAFPAAFPWFNTPRYWEERILELREQIALMQEPPLTVFGGNA